jgi:Novel STAND NTPase 1
VIDICCYEATGRMAEALSRHADEAYNELDESHRKIAEKMFKALTERGEDNREIRRPATLAAVAAVANVDKEEVKTVIETFRHPGRSFLMPPAETSLHSDTLIDISHESLIRVWNQLQQWVNEEAESATVYRRLLETALLRKENRSELWRGADLQVGLEWQEKNQPTEAWAKRQ